MDKEERRQHLLAIERYIHEHHRRTTIPDPLPRKPLHFASKRELGQKRPAAPKTGAILRGMMKAILKLTEKSFSETLLEIIRKKGKKAADIYPKAGITRQHFSKIRNRANYQPSKETALAFAIVLQLSLAETKDLIGRAGFTLSHSSKRDLLIEYCIKEGIYDVDFINDALYEMSCTPLTNWRESKDG